MENRPVPLLVGVGGLGSPAALYLAAAGVPAMTLVDFDVVDDTNLQRQVLFSTDDVGEPKVQRAARRLRQINPEIALTLVDEPFTADNARALVERASVVIDGTDNFAARYLVNDACVLLGKPNVFGSVSRFEGQVSVFAAADGPCYRCLHPEPPPEGLIPNCAEGGVLGVLPGFVGAIQAAEALKILTGTGRPLIGRLLLYDALRMRARQIDLRRDPDCPVCGETPTIRDLVAHARTCEPSDSSGFITPGELHAWRTTGRPHRLVDVREPYELASGRIEGAVLMPLASLGGQAAQLPRDCPIVVHCKSGARSARAAAELRALGLDARSLLGGLDAWARHDLVAETH